MDIFQMAGRGLQGIISGGISAEDYSAVTGIHIHDAKKILDSLENSEIGIIKNGVYYFDPGDRLKVAIALLEKGVSLDEVTPEIDWRDFEGLTTEMLATKNFAVMKNLRFKAPVIEIDVVAIRMGIALLVDCKHWKRTTPSAMSNVVAKQIERTRRYVAETPGAVAVPIIVTLYQHETEFVDNVPIVPIAGFSSFIDEFYAYFDKMKTIENTDHNTDPNTGSVPFTLDTATKSNTSAIETNL